jgi:hypothetical protein
MTLTKLLVGVALAGWVSHTLAADSQRSSIEPNQLLGKVPLAFETNVGQTDARVKYFARGNGYTAFLTANEAVLALTKRTVRHAGGAPSEASGAEHGSYDTVSAAVRMRFLEANSQPTTMPSGAMPAQISYLSASHAAPTQPELFQKVLYLDVWPGITVVFHGNQRQLEYDFVVAPGQTPSLIKLAFDGAKAVQVDPSSGDLVLTTEIGELRQPAPIIYQEINRERVMVDGRYTITGHQVGFQIGSFDPTKALVIDPRLAFADGFGGSGQDYATSVAVNQQTGEIYVAGYTNSPDFPITNSTKIGGLNDAFVSKISADGRTLLFSTLIGGSHNDEARGIALDALGNAYITGYTESADFPRVCAPNVVCTQIAFPPQQVPARFFVAEVDPTGRIIFSSAFGGSQPNYANAIAVYPNGGLVAVVGRTYSPNFPLVNSSGHLRGPSDGFLALIQGYPQVSGTLQPGTPGSIVFSTLIGGTGDESARSVAFVPNKIVDLVVVGWTNSSDFPVIGPRQASYQGGDADAFATRMQISLAYDIFGGIVRTDVSVETIYSEYLGGEGTDVANSVATDATGAAYLTGYTGSHYFPISFGCFQPYYGGAYSDAIIVKLDGNGRLVYSTYFGGSGDDYGEAILIRNGYVYLVGYTDSLDLPVTGNAFSTQEAGGWDTFAAILLDIGPSLIYASYFGTWLDDFAYGAALDSYGDLVFGGSTDATNTGATNVLLLKLNSEP